MYVQNLYVYAQNQNIYGYVYIFCVCMYFRVFVGNPGEDPDQQAGQMIEQVILLSQLVVLLGVEVVVDVFHGSK